jgi:hypothetical protein
MEFAPDSVILNSKTEDKMSNFNGLADVKFAHMILDPSNTSDVTSEVLMKKFIEVSVEDLLGKQI